MGGYSLTQARILVVDGNRNMRSVVEGVLRALGVRDITEASDGGEAFESLRASPADIILCDRYTRPVDGVDFTRMVRNGADSPNPFAAVIMQLAGATPHLLAEARAAGTHEVLRKPLSAKALYARIRAIVDYPRPFIRTPEYFGPDHRWRQTDFDGEDRRRSPPRATDAEAWTQAGAGNDDLQVVLTPEEIRALLSGGDDESLFIPSVPVELESDSGRVRLEDGVVESEPLLIPVPASYQLQVAYAPDGIDETTLRQAEAVIAGFRDDYLTWVQDDLARLQICVDQVSAIRPDDRAAGMQSVFDVAYDMSGQGGCFGYPLITVIGAQLCRFISDRSIFGDAEMRVVRLHVDAMRVVVAQRLEGDGGRNRDALVGGLRAVLAKIAKKDEVSS
jgi:CheY-like chemotaxis protein